MKTIRRLLNVIISIFCIILLLVGTLIEALVRLIASFTVCILWYVFTGKYIDVLSGGTDNYIILKITDWIMDKCIYYEY